MWLDDFVNEQLEYIKRNGLYRKRIILDEDVIDFSSNDYLGLKDNPETKEKIKTHLEKLALGSGASTLISGYYQIQKQLEYEISRLKQTESSLVIGSGYLANTGLIPALSDENTVIFSDEYNHASIIDGIRLSKAKKEIYRHINMQDLEDKLKKYKNVHKKIIITDGVFSMEGDIAPLKEINFLAKKYSAVLIIDDAHGTGVMGEGRGTLYHFGLEPEDHIIQMGTLSKAVGSYGAFISATKNVIDYLINKMRTAIFTTGLSPLQNFVSLEHIKLIQKNKSRIKKLIENTELLYQKMKENSIPVNYFGTPILTVIIGDEWKTLKIRDKLLKEKLFVQGIRPPTVPKGSSRLRITVSTKHTENDINLLLNKLKKVLDEEKDG